MSIPEEMDSNGSDMFTSEMEEYATSPKRDLVSDSSSMIEEVRIELMSGSALSDQEEVVVDFDDIDSQLVALGIDTEDMVSSLKAQIECLTEQGYESVFLVGQFSHSRPEQGFEQIKRSATPTDNQKRVLAEIWDGSPKKAQPVGKDVLNVIWDNSDESADSACVPFTDDQ